MDIDYNKLTIEELCKIRRELNVQINNRNKELGIRVRYKTEKNKQSITLVKFISEKIGYSIISKRRQKQYTYPRFIIANYLNDNTSDTIENIVSYLGIKDHSSIYHMKKVHQDLISINDVEYMIFYDRITNLIKEFYKINVNRVA
jgi:chromosomal replication initiation ATPase DnaA